MVDNIEIGSKWQGKNNEGDVLMVWANRNRVHYDYLNSLGNPMKDVYDVSISHFLEYFEPKTDMVNHPPHYKDESGVECIEVTKHMQFCGGNCFKYLYRAGKKGSTVEDLKKAAWYAERAWIGNEVVADFLHIDIKYIASHRNKYVGQAINAVSDSDWHEVYDLIIKETVRLESEASQ